MKAKRHSRVQAFMSATRGFPAWTVARALNTLTRGIDWRGCSKSDMALEWSHAKAGGIAAFPSLRRVTLKELRAILLGYRAQQNGDA